MSLHSYKTRYGVRVVSSEPVWWIEVWDAIAGAVIVLALIGIAVFLASPS
jgi:hypothetical protein